MGSLTLTFAWREELAKGDRLGAMLAFYTDEFVLPLTDGHRFPMAKYSMLRKAVEEHLGDRVELRVPPPVGDEDLRRAHTASYVEQVTGGTMSPSDVRRLGFPWSPMLVERSRRSAGGTLEACRAALVDGAGVNLAGGTHHAFADRGEGYCVFNDAAVAIRALQSDGCVDRALVVDCDVHQGNGTAAIFAEDASVFTFSIHGRRNFPFHKEMSDLDIALDDETGDAAYLAALDGALSEVLARARPDLAIYVAGADPWHGDRLGRLSLSKEGLRRRDRLVLTACRDAGLPVAVVMSGGYAPQVEDIVEIHLATVEAALVCSGA